MLDACRVKFDFLKFCLFPYSWISTFYFHYRLKEASCGFLGFFISFICCWVMFLQFCVFPCSECFVLWPFQLLRHLHRKLLYMVAYFNQNTIDFSFPIFNRFFVWSASWISSSIPHLVSCIILITTHDIIQVIYLVYSIMLNIFSLRVVFPIC